MDTTEKHTALFTQLVLMLHASGMQHLGKLHNPLTGTVERNLPAAQGSIDMLDMLQRFTKGNLDSAEARLLADAARELKLNYVDEAAKPEPATPPVPPPPEGGAP
jgi:hypothetical protein